MRYRILFILFLFGLLSANAQKPEPRAEVTLQTTKGKIVLSLYNDIPSEKFAADTGEAALFGNITAADIPWLMTEADGINLAKTAISYSDGVIMGSEGVPAELGDFCSELKLPVLPFDANALESGKYVEDYDNFYDSL